VGHDGIATVESAGGFEVVARVGHEEPITPSGTDRGPMARPTALADYTAVPGTGLALTPEIESRFAAHLRRLSTVADMSNTN